MLNGVETRQGRGAGPKYGLAVQIRQTEWGASYGHGGWFPGYLSEMQYFPDKKVAIAIQFNTDNTRGLKKGLAAYVADFARIVIDAIEEKKKVLRARRPATPRYVGVMLSTAEIV